MVQPTPEVVGSAIVALGAAGSAAYAVYKGRGASVDVDDDGNDEVTIDPVPEPCESMADQTEQNGAEDDDGEDDEPSFEADDLTDVTGIAESRAEKLNDAGIDTVLDLYEADDETITSVDGMGDHALGQIRDDIGAAGDEDGPREMNDDLEEAITEAEEKVSEGNEETQASGSDDEGGDGEQNEADDATDDSSETDDS